MTETNGTNNSNIKNGNFICGVVEGFYGRPWTSEQRKDLFQKMKKWGMDSYLYAPKDDYKHRAFWRDLYTVEEAEHLTGLITSARDSGITFYYALSPGLDITYSSVKEVTALKRKLEQVSQFGCTAFALLFDDIEPEMSEADKEVFQSFAHAQVSVTNDIFQHLGQPKFLLCPTQYCATRAMPNVPSSEYLNTLGSKLAQEIDIMWTGPKVISRLLTPESIEEITEVLRRPPVIWDNLHANDYDQKRVFLGPYSGRSPDLIPKLRGVLTNPNCEYGANFIAIHTLAQWSRCNVDGKRDLSLNDTVSADIKLETETEDGVVGEDVPSTLSPNMYHPRHALKAAIKDWLGEFSKKKAAWGVIAKPQPAVAPTVPIPIIPSVNTCMSLTATSTVSTVSSAPITAPGNTNHLAALAEVCSSVTSDFPGPTGPAMNSLVSDNKVEPVDTGTGTSNSGIGTACSENGPGTVGTVGTGGTEAQKVGTEDGTGARNQQENLESPEITEPMDCNTTPSNSPSQTVKDDEAMVENTSTCSGTSGSMQVEEVNGTQMIVETDGADGEGEKDKDKMLTIEDLGLLCDLFYLPFEHGGQGIQVLQEFNWLKSNAHVVLKKKDESCKADYEEWLSRAAKFNDMCEAVNRLFQRMTYCDNRELLYDLYSYIWDMRGVISLLNSYVKWLAFGKFQSSMTTFTQGSYTWFSNGWKETFMSGDQEPWVFRGGLTADLQRLIPVDSGNDLFVYKAPEVPTSIIYTVRPYLPSDEDAVYALCNQITGVTGTSAVADRLVGGFLTISPEFCMMVEDDSGLVGYALTALNIKTYYKKMAVAWIPELKAKYPLEDITNDLPESVQEAIRYFHSFSPEVPEQLSQQFPSLVMCSLLPTVTDQSIAKRLITCSLAALRANGSFGIHTTISAMDKESHEFYGKLGFVDYNQGQEELPGVVTMSRSF
ncbi:O-GlcNAcase isoform X1 [Cotesia typhae]|uniref:O-GlcNAcase isoform X1 n=1 Tax=Cotesia typhae TaxID=2053667 RepID=UPI003D68B5DE